MSTKVKGRVKKITDIPQENAVSSTTNTEGVKKITDEKKTTKRKMAGKTNTPFENGNSISVVQGAKEPIKAKRSKGNVIVTSTRAENMDTDEPLKHPERPAKAAALQAILKTKIKPKKPVTSKSVSEINGVNKYNITDTKDSIPPKKVKGKRPPKIHFILEGIEKEKENIEDLVNIKKGSTNRAKKDAENDLNVVEKTKIKVNATLKTTKVPRKLNAIATKYESINFNMNKKFNLKISSWNITGLKTWLTKGGIEFIHHEKPDILCLQETKYVKDLVPNEAHVSGYHQFWLCRHKNAGVAMFSKIMPINVEYGLGNDEQNESDRLITAEYEKFFLVCACVPKAGKKLTNLSKRMRWDNIFQNYIKKLNEKKTSYNMWRYECFTSRNRFGKSQK